MQTDTVKIDSVKKDTAGLKYQQHRAMVVRKVNIQQQELNDINSKLDKILKALPDTVK